MYCKNRGKSLRDGDKFCSNCGTKVEEEFVPAFRQEEPVPQEPKISQERPAAQKSGRNFTIEKFDWDLAGYPTSHKKTEDINFNWDSVLEEKQRNAFSRETERPSEGQAEKAGVWDIPGAPSGRETDTFEEAAAQKTESPLFSDEPSLEDAIFADMGSLRTDEPTKFVERPPSKSKTIDKFYTFNKKNEEFQALLDREYERIKNGQSPSEEIAAPAPKTDRHEEFDWTLPGDREFSDLLTKQEEKNGAREEFEGFVQKPVYVGVALAKTPEGYVHAEEPQKGAPEEVSGILQMEKSGADQSAPAEAAEGDKPQTEARKEEKANEAPGFPCSSESQEPRAEQQSDEDEKSRLTFVDVFADDDDDFEDKPKKKGKVLKVIAVILCILVVVELIAIGIQYFAPDSKAAKFINSAYESVGELFLGGGEEEPEEPAEPVTEESEIAQLIDAKKNLGKNIAAIEEDQELTFEDGKDYGFDGFLNSYTFTNKPWYTDEDGNSVSYGEEIIATVIQYYSSWVDKINGKNEKVLEFIDDTADFYTEIESLEGEEDVQYGINKLTIGEIRAGGSGFFVCVSAAVAESDSNKETAEKQIVYMEPVNRTMKIVDIEKI